MIHGITAVLKRVQVAIHKDEVKSHKDAKFMLKFFAETCYLQVIMPLYLSVGFCRRISEGLDNNTKKHHHLLCKISQISCVHTGFQDNMG